MKFALTLFLCLTSSLSFSKESISENISHVKSAFSHATILKLNKITRDSLNIINEFDEVNKDLETDEKNKKIKIAKLKSRSNDSLMNMREAIANLKKSKEVYNEAILSGMLSFVEKVNREISLKYLELSAKK